MKRFLWALAGVAGGFAVASCGGNVVVDGLPGDRTPWESYCETRDADCGISAVQCQNQETCAKLFLRDAVEEALVECLRTNCKQDACFAAITVQFPPTDTGAKWLAGHEAYLQACPTGNDDIQIIGWILTDDALADFIACLDVLTCSAITACIEQVQNATVGACKDWL
jgi:hypothetical protein